MRRVRESRAVGGPTQRLAGLEQTPHPQEPSPEYVRVQGHPGLLDKEMPEAAGRQVRVRRDVVQRELFAEVGIHVCHCSQDALVRNDRRLGLTRQRADHSPRALLEPMRAKGKVGAV
jgi:hypothetical protein